MHIWAAGALTLAAALILASSGALLALDESPVPAAGGTESAAPPPPPPEKMSVVPGEEGAPPPAKPAAKVKPKHHAASVSPVEVDPAHARLKIKQDAWIFSGPSKSTKHITRARAGKYVSVTGSTHYYLQVNLKNGQTGYISPSAVELVTPTDKIFQLTSDAPVLQEPNRWSKKVSAVHRGHSVHVTGLALNYMQIKMKSGLVGFIPVTALQ